MNINRLIILAKHLRLIETKVPEATGRGARSRGFDLGKWTYFPVSGAEDFKGRPCGTAACAFGEATFIPEFKKMGLTRKAGIPAFNGRSAFGAASAFFGISYDDAENLFDPANYVTNDQTTPKQVADRIAALITRP